MNCKRCGAKIKKNMTKCIYCGTPVRKNDSYKNKKASAKSRALLVFGVLLIVLSAAVIVNIKIGDRKTAKQHDDSIVTLEKYFRSKDYAMIYQYVSENGIYGDEFEKYVQIYEVYGYRKAALDKVKNINSYSSQTSADTFRYAIQSVMSNCLIGIKDAERYANDYDALGNEEMLNYLIQDLKKLMKDNLKLDNQAVDELCSIKSITEASLYDYVSQAYENLKG